MDTVSPPPPPQPGTYIPGQTPKVITWYKVYLGVVIAMMLLFAGIGAFLFFGPLTAEDLDGMPPQLMGGIYMALGLLMTIPFAVAFFCRKNHGAGFTIL